LGRIITVALVALAALVAPTIASPTYSQTPADSDQHFISNNGGAVATTMVPFYRNFQYAVSGVRPDGNIYPKESLCVRFANAAKTLLMFRNSSGEPFWVSNKPGNFAPDPTNNQCPENITPVHPRTAAVIPAPMALAQHGPIGTPRYSSVVLPTPTELPQSTFSQPSYQQTQATDPSSGNFAYLVGGLIVIGIIAVFLYIASKGRSVRLTPKTDAQGFAVANYDVPHCEFKRTADGFIIKFNKASLDLHQSMSKHWSPANAGQSAFGSAVVGVKALGSLTQKPTVIEVTREVVTIDGKKMRRDDFGNFFVGSSLRGQHRSKTVAVLGYQFGNQSFEFGGAWDENEAEEVASALNTQLRRLLPIDEAQVSPQALRDHRPQDF